MKIFLKQRYILFPSYYFFVIEIPAFKTAFIYVEAQCMTSTNKDEHRNNI